MTEAPVPFKPVNGRLLVTGVYLSDRENTIDHIFGALGDARGWKVEQRWAAIGKKRHPGPAGKATLFQLEKGEPKFVLINRLLTGVSLDRYDFILVSDDDISLPPRFLERYLDLVLRYDFALAQPARTTDSHIDHSFTAQLNGLSARRTRFVEIGPLFSMRRDVFPSLLPFDESAYMGWGCDFVWPCLMEKAGKRMGIIDDVPMEHSMRKSCTYYGHEKSSASMESFLAANPHLTRDEAFTILESFD